MDYEYHSSNRSIGMTSVLIVGLPLLILGFSTGTPWAWLGLLAVVCGLIVIYWLMSVPYALFADAEGIRWSSGKTEISVARADVAHVEVMREADTATLRVVTRTGEKLNIPAPCYPSVAAVEAGLTGANYEVRDVG